MTPINVVLSVFYEVSPYFFEAVKIGHYPEFVDARKLLQERKATLRDFVTAESRTAPGILRSEVPETHCKRIENNNRATERIIGKLKGIVQHKIRDSSSHLNKTDIRIKAFLCNME